MANQRSIQTSLFSLTNNSTNPNQHSVAIKDTEISTSYSHYAFGTAMFFPGTVNDVVSSGGLGFFTSSNGNTGYYVSVQTTTHLSDTADKEIKNYLCFILWLNFTTLVFTHLHYFTRSYFHTLPKIPHCCLWLGCFNTQCGWSINKRN